MAVLSMVHLHIKGDQEHALALLHETLIATRERTGCVGVETVQDRDDPCHVVLLETWASPESWRSISARTASS